MDDNYLDDSANDSADTLATSDDSDSPDPAAAEIYTARQIPNSAEIIKHTGTQTHVLAKFSIIYAKLQFVKSSMFYNNFSA